MNERLAHLRRDLVQELLLEEAVIRVLVIERHGSLVGEEHLPFVEPDGIFCGAWRREESLRERLRERAAGHSYLEGVMAVEAGCLAGNDVGSEGGGQRVDGGEREEVWLSCHLDDRFAERLLKTVAGAFRSAIDSWVFLFIALQGWQSVLGAGFQWQQRRILWNGTERSEGETTSYLEMQVGYGVRR